MQNNGAKLVIGIENLAEALGVTKPTVYQYIKLGMPCNRIGNRFHFHLDNVNLWLIAITGGKYEGNEDPETLEDSEQ